MEFFKIVNVISSEMEIKEQLTLQNLEKFCVSVFPLDEGSEVCKIGGMWGEFMLRLDQIMGGVRYSMLDCPNALAWTITTGYPPARDKVVVHLTINRERKQEEFVEEIRQFLADLEFGLMSFLSEKS
jgi:hypothetical protein